MTTPSDNYYWRGISRQDKVVDCGTHWEVYSWLGRNMGVVYWEGQETVVRQFPRKLSKHRNTFAAVQSKLKNLLTLTRK